MLKTSFRDCIINLAKAMLSPEVRNWVVRQQKRFHLQWPPAGTVRFGSFRRLTPISPIFAIDRGFPIERYYIEKFLSERSSDIRGHALEMGDDFYLRKFGGNRIEKIDVLSVVQSPNATIVADLTCSNHLPSNTFDCIILTQTLQMIFDVKAALKHLHRILKPGGALLLTSHGISKIGRRLGRDNWGEYWHITTQSAERLFLENFPDAEIQVNSYGNVLTAMCSLHGLSSEELSTEELNHVDPDFEVIVTVRAVKR
ncbi:methylase [Candidatus Scalindua japonica]|uniref:Methylase n=1 Tax=Candidatus Scalindua japonica TaxID=1284222 RepID=A0A286TXA7_9BACT|nr:methyltransferase domain-containing protein [Candidatus Scalindua japonica]GAX60451.1 methylase [Candidatus Scalindua japonica]